MEWLVLETIKFDEVLAITYAYLQIMLIITISETSMTMHEVLHHSLADRHVNQNLLKGTLQSLQSNSLSKPSPIKMLPIRYSSYSISLSFLKPIAFMRVSSVKRMLSIIFLRSVSSFVIVEFILSTLFAFLESNLNKCCA